ncbi:serine protease [Bacillus toyonensis]|nr:serine protease [Bacillus toyonensis]PHD34731.1 serine protease [Bacillus toyonensis]
MNKYFLHPFEVRTVTEEALDIPAGVRMIKAPEIWDQSNKGDNVVVAIIDSGCMVNHPDLAGRIIDVKNFVLEEGTADDVTDKSGHGTHVAGTIGAILNDQYVAGVAPEVKILVVKVMEPVQTPRGIRFATSAGRIINAIRYCIDWRGPNGERVRVINMSFGDKHEATGLHDAIIDAVNADILLICAAGNEGDNNPNTEEVSYPAYFDEVVCVGAVTLQKKITDFTNTNDGLDLVAPGEDIKSTYKDGKVRLMSGTSMAAPHVSGAAALVINQCEKDFRRSFTESEVFAQLIKRTVTLGYSPVEEGNGLLVLTEGYRHP